MKLTQIYERPIDRTIDSAVTVSNRKKDTVENEIFEYVFTTELIDKLYTFLENVLHKKTNRTGIWINGYYGSGKSHFIKYIDYCLTPSTRDKAFKHFREAAENADDFSEATPSNILNMQAFTASNDIQTITFNVEDETDDGSGERLTRIFINMLNRHRGYNSDNIPLAILLEKELDKKGVFEEFQKVLNEEYGFEWKGNEQNTAGFALDTVLEAAKKVLPSLDEKSLYSRINDSETYKVGIKSTLIPELKDYLKGKDKNFRLLFLVDEISQYIGKNKEVLLNFQNIIERVSEDLDSKVWIACTAQQTLDDVAQGTGSDDIKEEFGKILGRFAPDLRVSLESSDPAYITQKRVLDKNAEGRIAVEGLYRTNVDAIESQFKMHHDLYKGYTAEDEFVLSYPFVPYQFKLIADVFDAFQSLQFVIKEVKNNERSVLGITHFTAKKAADLEVGHIVPFDAFYNDQFNTNLTHRGRRAIKSGLDLSYIKNNPFAARVLKTLFMISNLSESVRQTFPSTVENLTLLLMSGIDENKLQLQKQIREVVDRLMDESIIREEHNSFFFFNEDEMDVKMQIQNTHLNYEDRLDMFGNMIRRIVTFKDRIHFGDNDFRIGLKIDDKEVIRGGNISVKVVVLENNSADDKAFGNPHESLLLCVNEWFRQDKELVKEFEQYTKTEKYLLHNGDSAQGTRDKTLSSFRTRNASLHDRIIEKLRQKFNLTRFVSGQQVIDASEVQGTKPADRFTNVVTRHLKNYYRDNQLADGYISNGNDLKKKIHSIKAQLLTDNELSPAENRVNDHITNMGGSMSVDDIVRIFNKAPYGWKDIQVLHVIVMLCKKKVREIEYRNNPRYALDLFVNKALVSSERQVLIAKQGEAIPANLVEEARSCFQDIFNTEAPNKTDGNELYEEMVQAITGFKADAENQAESYVRYPFRSCFHNYYTYLEDLVTIRDPKRFFDTLSTSANKLKALSDQCKQMDGFLSRAFQEYKKIKGFLDLNTDNLAALDSGTEDKVKWLKDFFEQEDPTADFRTARKVHSELSSGIKTKLKELHIEAETAYSGVFDTLEAEATKSGVDLTALPSRSHKLDSLKRLSGISALTLTIRDAASFKSKQLGVILQEANKKKAAKSGNKVEERPVTYKPGKGSKFSVISTQNELDEYLTKVRTEMEKILKENKKIILE